MKNNQKFKITFADGSTHIYKVILYGNAQRARLFAENPTETPSDLFDGSVSLEYLQTFLNTVVKAEEVEETVNLGDYFKITCPNSTGYYILARAGFGHFYLVNAISGIVWDSTPIHDTNMTMSLLYKYVTNKLSGLVNVEIVKIGNYENFRNEKI